MFFLTFCFENFGVALVFFISGALARQRKAVEAAEAMSLEHVTQLIQQLFISSEWKAEESRSVTLFLNSKSQIFSFFFHSF